MTSIRLQGVGVSPGLAVAPIMRIRWAFPEVGDRTVADDEVDGEIARLHDAVNAVAAALDGLRLRTLQRAGAEEAGIFDAQIMMARDEEFLAGVEALIRKNNLWAETAYEFKALELRNAWQGSQVMFLRDRLADLHAVQIRMLAHLMGRVAGGSLVG